MPGGTRKTGEFCWINMLTPQPEEARAFFGQLLGWSYVELPGVGHVVKVAGHEIGGLFDLAGPNVPQRTPPLIGVMVKVESADAMVEKVTSLGKLAHVGLLRSQRRRVRRVGAEEGTRHRCGQQPTRRSKLVRDDDNRR